MPRLYLRLLGAYRAELDGEAVYDFESDKVRALLAYLAVEADRPHRRETLASLLWPDRPDSAARANLRHALSCLRRTLLDEKPPLFLFVSPSDVQFNAASDYRLDVAELESFACSPGRGEQLLPEALCADFLSGFSVPDSEAFQTWVLDKQEYYHRLAIEILNEQNAYFEGIGEHDRAVTTARLQLRLEPWLEEAHRRCMRGLALAGRRDEALRQYEACRRALAAELGVEPAESTKSLYADIRAGRIGEASHGTRGGDKERGRSVGVTLSPPLPLPQSAFRPVTPSLSHRLVAREDELGQLGRHLDAALAGETGVAFVSGDPGSGKTALLEAFAPAAMAQHPDLLVTAARCSPDGSLDAFAPLRKLAEMLFGHPGNGVAWLPAGQEQMDRLLAATGPALAALAEQGSGLVDRLVPASSVAARAGRASLPQGGSLARLAQPDGGAPQEAASQGVLSQGALFDQFICTLASIATEQPLLLLFDDLHWVDEASAAFIQRLGRELSGSRLLVLGAYRPTMLASSRRDPASGDVVRPPLAAVINDMRSRKGEIVVDLDRADGRAFVEQIVDTEPNRLGAHFRDALYAQTGGHALFTVETLRNLQARGQLIKDEAGRWVARESLDWRELPARVEATIAERIERLPERERRILSAASVQGDGFSGELASELAGAPASEVLPRLSGSLARQHGLVRPEGVQRVAGGQRSLYRFTHHLFQKYLYDDLDPVERAQWHAAVAASLDRQAGDDPVERERISAALAWHYEAGGMPLQAARALLNAGRQAMKVSAPREAVGRFDHALALLSDEPPSPERTELERLLHTDRLAPQAAADGTGSLQLEGALASAAGAGEHAERGRPRLLMLQANENLLNARGQFEDGLAVAQQMLEEATRCGDEGFVANAHYWTGLFRHLMGQLHEADARFELAIARLTPELDADLRAAASFELSALVLSFSALNRWILGYPEEAQARAVQVLARAVARGDLYGQAFASALGSMTLFLLRCDPETLRARAEPGHRLCQREGIGWWQDYLEVFLGRLGVMAGGPDAGAGIERMRSAIAGWQAKGMVIGTDGLLVVLADGCLAAARQDRAAGRTDVAGGGLPAGSLAIGLAAIEPFLGPKVPCGQSFQAELLRMRAELLLARDGLAAAEEALASLQQAARLAQQQGALAWELRAAMSLVRLRQRQCAEGAASAGELAEARSCLAEVYGRFTEGFEFPDLQEATALIGERL